MIADLVDHFFRGGAADVGLRSGAESFGHLRAHLHDALGLRHGERLGVGIGDDEVDALQARRDHVVDGIAAGAADAEHGNARLHLANVGDLQIDSHEFASLCTGGMPRSRFLRQRRCAPPNSAGPPPALSWFWELGSEAFAQPSSDPCHVTARSCHQLPRSPRFEVFKMCRLRVDQQARRHGESRALGRFRQARRAQADGRYAPAA